MSVAFAKKGRSDDWNEGDSARERRNKDGMVQMMVTVTMTMLFH